MSEQVTVRTRYWQAECYHTDPECVNKQRINRPKQMSKAQAEEYGLHECLHCRGESITQERTHDSLRYAISRGEVELD
jgi:hypothetical protein